jgi:aminotransferase EvaB
MKNININDLLLQNQHLQAELEAAASRVIASGWYSLGPEVDLFEKNFAAWCGGDYCRGVANGTDAIELGLRALGVQAGNEVIVAANAGMYSCTAISSIGAIPVYADINPVTFNIDPHHSKTLITASTRAIIATHLYGQLCDMPNLKALAEQYRLGLLEDCAQSPGASLDGKKAGTWGDIGAFSFYPTKNLGALGDGGAIITSREDLYSAVTQLRQYGWKTRYNVVRSGGFNSRLDELQAALLNVKLPYLEMWTRKRQSIGKFYVDQIKHPLVQVATYTGEQHVYHLYVLRCSRRDELKNYLKNNGIASDIHYPLLDYQQPVFVEQPISTTRLPHSEKAINEIITLPCYPELSLDDARFVVDTINSWIPN